MATDSAVHASTCSEEAPVMQPAKHSGNQDGHTTAIGGEWEIPRCC